MIYKLYITFMVSIFSLSNALLYVNNPLGILNPQLYMNTQPLTQESNINFDDLNLDSRSVDVPLSMRDLFWNKDFIEKEQNAGFLTPLSLESSANFEDSSPESRVVDVPASMRDLFWNKDFIEKEQNARFLTPLSLESSANFDDFNPESRIVDVPISLRDLFGKKNLNDKEANARLVVPKFMNPVALLKHKFVGPQTKMTVEEMRNKTCNDKGGVLINGECYQYVSQLLPFEQARQHCMARGGDLWTPDYTDAYLFNKLIEKLPILAAAPGKKVWIGARLTNGRSIDVNSVDATDTYFFRVNMIVNPTNECYVYSFFFGYQLSGVDNCVTQLNHFICEYPIRMEDPGPDHIVFNKFHLKFFKG